MTRLEIGDRVSLTNNQTKSGRILAINDKTAFINFENDIGIKEYKLTSISFDPLEEEITHRRDTLVKAHWSETDERNRNNFFNGQVEVSETEVLR